MARFQDTHLFEVSWEVCNKVGGIHTVLRSKASQALQEFGDYLKYYRDTDTAPNAQYYVGEISYNRKDYETALKAFDAVLEQFPEGKNTKLLDAMFMKGRTLVLMGDKAGAIAEFRAVVKRAPTSELATKAKAQLASLGAVPARKTTHKATP